MAELPIVSCREAIKAFEKIQGKEDDIKNPCHAIYSVFSAIVPDSVMNLARRCLAAGQEIRNEGITVIKRLEELDNTGSWSAAATGLILQDYLMHYPLCVPNPAHIHIERIGMPRVLLEQYLEDFQYNRPVRICT